MSQTLITEPACRFIDKPLRPDCSVLVVGHDSLSNTALTTAIDPLRLDVVAVNSLEAADRIKQGGTRIVILQPRHVDPTGLVFAIRTFDPSVTLIVASSTPHGAPPALDGVTIRFAENLAQIKLLVNESKLQNSHPTLTGRQIDVLRRLVTGHTPARAAADIGISKKTLDNHLSEIYRRCGTRNLIATMLYAIRTGLVQL
jgi:DNA-binding NarL/FixJ family response regulator